MAKASQTSNKQQPLAQEDAAATEAARRLYAAKVEGLQRPPALAPQPSSDRPLVLPPMRAWEYATVTFTDAHRDTAVAHSLVGIPVRWIVVTLECLTGSPIEAPVVYANGGPGARPEGAGSITLRSTVPNVRARVLLFQEAS